MTSLGSWIYSANMKEKNRSPRIIPSLLVSIVVLILGFIVFTFSIAPAMRQQRHIRYTEAYFQALQEGDIQTASKYIGSNASSNVDDFRSEWIEKASKLQASDLKIESIEELTFVDDDLCGRVELIVVAKRGNEREVFKTGTFTDPYCAILFDGLDIIYGVVNDMSELEKDAKFFIASDVTR